MTINGDPEVREPCMFVKGMYLYLFYCLCYDTDISTDMSEDQVAEERDPDLNEKEDIKLDEMREEHWFYQPPLPPIPPLDHLLSMLKRG